MHRLRTFGLVDLRDREGAALLQGASGTEPLALLVYLAVARPVGRHSRDRLATLLWPGAQVARRIAALNGALDVLEVALGAGALVDRDDHGVALDPDAYWCDAAAFRIALDTGHTADALALYRGDFLQEFQAPSSGFQRWMKAERGVLRRQGAHGARELADQHESSGRLTTAVTWAKRGLELQFDDERALRRLLRLLDRAGDRQTALRIYERFSRKLRDGYSREPGPLTTELVRRIHRAGRMSNQEPGSARIPGPPLPPESPRPQTEHRA